MSPNAKKFPTMKFTRISSVLLTLLVLQSCVSLSVGETLNGIAAVVNGKVITRSEVREAVEAQTQNIRVTVRDMSEQQRLLDELHEHALDALIERQLVLSEFDKMGGSIRPEYVDDEINNIVRDNFQGDRDKFIFELTK